MQRNNVFDLKIAFGTNFFCTQKIKLKKVHRKQIKCIVVHAKSEVCCKDTGSVVDYYTLHKYLCCMMSKGNGVKKKTIAL
jgi:hypothetical protein